MKKFEIAINERVIEAINYLLSSKIEPNKAKLADNMGVKPSKFSEILNRRMKAGMDIIQKLCIDYKVSADWLITGEGSTILPEDRLKIEKYFAEVSPEFLIICKMCYNCLIRPKEALQLRIGNINVKDKLLIIPADVAKNHHERHVAMPDSIMEYMMTVATLPPKYYIFSTGYKPGTKLLTTRETGKTWSTMRNKLNMPKEYQFYSLKDTGITDMLEKGVPPKYVKELADHSSLEMTEKYLHKSTAHEILKHTQMTW